MKVLVWFRILVFRIFELFHCFHNAKVCWSIFGIQTKAAAVYASAVISIQEKKEKKKNVENQKGPYVSAYVYLVGIILEFLIDQNNKVSYKSGNTFFKQINKKKLLNTIFKQKVSSASQISNNDANERYMKCIKHNNIIYHTLGWVSSIVAKTIIFIKISSERRSNHTNKPMKRGKKLSKDHRTNTQASESHEPNLGQCVFSTHFIFGCYCNMKEICLSFIEWTISQNWNKKMMKKKTTATSTQWM